MDSNLYVCRAKEKGCNADQLENEFFGIAGFVRATYMVPAVRVLDVNVAIFVPKEMQHFTVLHGIDIVSCSGPYKMLPKLSSTASNVLVVRL